MNTGKQQRNLGHRSQPHSDGIGGERIKKIKNIYGVEINTTETDSNMRTFTITGNQQDITKATKIIKAIAKEAQEKDSDRAETSQYTNARPEARQKDAHQMQILCLWKLYKRQQVQIPTHPRTSGCVNAHWVWRQQPRTRKRTHPTKNSRNNHKSTRERTPQHQRRQRRQETTHQTQTPNTPWGAPTTRPKQDTRKKTTQIQRTSQIQKNNTVTKEDLIIPRR